MNEPMMYAADFPRSQLRSPGNTASARVRLVYFILSVLVVALVGGSMYWLQWASQRGVKLGYPLPVVHITSAPPGQLLIHNAAQFSAAATGRDLSYLWDFGDGTSDVGPAVSHLYQSNGTFTVTVRTYDPIGQTSSETTSVRVVPPAPTASFTYSVSYGYTSFDATSSTADTSTSIASYNWDFGDGSNDPNGSAQEYHQYYNTGTYQVTLVVTDATGQTSSPYTANIVIS